METAQNLSVRDDMLINVGHHIKEYKIEDKDKGVALAHLYRAEVGRMTTFRVRLDSSTHWCILPLGVIIAVILERTDIPHYAMVIPLAIVLFNLRIESRRYVVYDICRRRCRLMEKQFFNQIFNENTKKCGQELYDSYSKVRPNMSTIEATIIRLRRIYNYLILLVYIAWIVKLSIVKDFNLVFVIPVTVAVALMFIFAYILNKKYANTDNETDV